MGKIHRSFSDIDQAYSNLSPDKQRLLEKCLMNLSEIVSLSIEDQDPSKSLLSAVANYSTKKIFEGRSSYSPHREPNSSLRHLRNILAHGKSLKHFEPTEIRKYETVMWHALEKSSGQWNPIELTNFLSYCLRTNIPVRSAQEVEPKKLVRIYKAIYNAFDEQQKERAFKELTLRLFSEDRFLIALDEISLK